MRFLIFAAGAAAGSALTYLYLYNYYEKREEELREYYKKKLEPEVVADVDAEEVTNDSDKKPESYDKPNPHLSTGFRKEADYFNYSGETIREFSPSEDDDPKPYVITPDEYSEHVVSDVVYLTYYKEDDKLAGPDGSIYDIDSTVGRSAIERIGEYIPGICYVRDLALSTDYEISSKDCSYGEDFGG